MIRIQSLAFRADVRLLSRSNLRRPLKLNPRPHSLRCFSSLSPKEEHDLRVAEAIKRAQARHAIGDASTSSSSPNRIKAQEKTLTIPQPPTQAQSMHTVANNIQHWLSKDQTYFDATMKALNLKADTKNSDHPLHVLFAKNRHLYYDSIRTFRDEMRISTAEEGTSVDSELGNAMTKLERAGFVDPQWAKRFRATRRFRKNQERIKVQVSELATEFARRKEMLQMAESQLGDLLDMERQAKQKA